jgi:hypothetical protein
VAYIGRPILVLKRLLWPPLSPVILSSFISLSRSHFGSFGTRNLLELFLDLLKLDCIESRNQIASGPLQACSNVYQALFGDHYVLPFNYVFRVFSLAISIWCKFPRLT